MKGVFPNLPTLFHCLPSLPVAQLAWQGSLQRSAVLGVRAGPPGCVLDKGAVGEAGYSRNSSAGDLTAKPM